LPFSTADTVERDTPLRRAISFAVMERLGLCGLSAFTAYPRSS
jgi:hypothetical protein